MACGEITCRLGDREIEVPEGGFVLIPRGTPHTAWNSGDAPMLGMIVISPGGAEHVFEPAQTTDVAALAERRQCGFARKGAVKRMLAQSARTVSPLAAVLIDLDHFKQVNDTSARETATPCWRRLATCSRARCGRATSLGATAARSSSSCCLTPAPGALEVAEKLRDAIATIKLPRVERAITASFGVAIHTKAAGDAETLLRPPTEPSTPPRTPGATESTRRLRAARAAHDPLTAALAVQRRPRDGSRHASENDRPARTVGLVKAGSTRPRDTSRRPAIAPGGWPDAPAVCPQPSFRWLRQARCVPALGMLVGNNGWAWRHAGSVGRWPMERAGAQDWRRQVTRSKNAGRASVQSSLTFLVVSRSRVNL